MSCMTYRSRMVEGCGLHDFVAQLPERFALEGDLVRKERNVLKTMDVDGRKVVVKQFRRPNIVQRLSYSTFRKGKAFRAYDNALQLKARGFDTPEPLACVEQRRLGIYQRSWYVYAYDDGIPLDTYDGFDHRLIKAFAHLVVRLHEAGVLYHDLNRGNFLCHFDEGEVVRFSMIDTNRARFPRRISLNQCIADFIVLPVREYGFEYFARCYLEERGWLDEALLDEIMRRKFHRDGRRHPFKHLKNKKTVSI